jgi:hypothetical protein
LIAPPLLDAASTAAATTLLNCYLREAGPATFSADDRATFPPLGIEADVTHRSATLHHRFAAVPPSACRWC